MHLSADSPARPQSKGIRVRGARRPWGDSSSQPGVVGLGEEEPQDKQDQHHGLAGKYQGGALPAVPCNGSLPTATSVEGVVHLMADELGRFVFRSHEWIVPMMRQAGWGCLGK